MQAAARAPAYSGQGKFLPVGTAKAVAILVILEMFPAEFYARMGLACHWPDKKGNAMLCQYLMSQTKIIGGISCGFLHREQSHNPLHLRQIRRFIAGIPCRCRNVQDNTVVCVQGLVAQVVHPVRFIGTVEPACVWICPAHPPVGVFWFPFQNFYPFLFLLSRLLGQIFSGFLLVCVQPFPICTRFFRRFRQIDRGPRGTGLHMGGVRRHQASAGKAHINALLRHPLKQPPEYLPKGRFPPPQLADRAVIRHSFIQINAKIPTKGHVCPNALLNLPLRGNATQKARQHVLYHDHRVNGRPAILLIV